MATLNERMVALRTANESLQERVLAFEYAAVGVLEDAQRAGDIEFYRDAMLHQRAGHVAYDALNDVLTVEPDGSEREHARYQSITEVLRANWIRWLTNADHDMIARFDDTMRDVIAEYGDDRPNITPSA